MNRSLILPVGILILLFAWTEASFYLRPDLVAHEGFLFIDESLPLWHADQLSQGKVLYRDVSSPYGVLSAWTYTCFAALCGNSPESYVHLQQIYSLLAALLLWIFLSRHLRPSSAALFLVIFIAPYLLSVGSTAGALCGESNGLERLCLITLLLFWRPSQLASLRYLALIGVFLGAMQLAKFGGGIVAMGAWILADFCVSEVSWLKLIRPWTFMVAGCLATSLIWLIILLVWLPWRIALDVFFPHYATLCYAVFYLPGQSTRWPAYINAGYFLGEQLGPLVAAILFVGTVVFILRHRIKNGTRIDPASVGPFLFAGFFVSLGIFIYLKHVGILFNYAWLLILAGAWRWNRFGLVLRIGLALLWLPVFYLNARGPWLPMPQKIQPIVMPNGQVLWASPKTALRIQRVEALVNDLISRHPSQDCVIGIPFSSGWYHFCGWHQANRNLEYQIGYIRPYDEPDFIESLRHTAAIIIISGGIKGTTPTTDPLTWNPALLPPTFSDNLRAVLLKKLEPPVTIDDECWVFPVLPDKAD